MVLVKPAGIPHCAKIVRYAWEIFYVSLSVQDFHRLHFEIVIYAAASIPKEVRAYPERGSGPVERGLRLDLLMGLSHKIDQMQYQIPPLLRFPAFPK